MQNKNKDPFLNHREYVTDIAKQPEFQANRPERGAESNEAYIRQMRVAVGMGAIAAARHLKQERSGFDVKPRVLDMVAKLPDFHDTQQRLESYQQKYQEKRSPRAEYQQFKKDKESVIEFNHTIRDVIESSNDRFDFNELLNFMTNMHMSINGPESRHEFYQKTRDVLFGVRNEIATEAALLRYSDYDIEMGDAEDDATGVDMYINGVPFDIKNSQGSVNHARDKAREYGRNPDLIIWSYIDMEDFDGKLTLSDVGMKRAANKMSVDIEAGIKSYNYSDFENPATRISA